MMPGLNLQNRKVNVNELNIPIKKVVRLDLRKNRETTTIT
jgi:hypothetical protein